MLSSAPQASCSSAARRGLVADGHGDLRAEHVVLDRPARGRRRGSVRPGPARRGTSPADLGFLVMDLEGAGRRTSGRALVAAYRAAGGDPGDDALLAAVACYRALVRGQGRRVARRAGRRRGERSAQSSASRLALRLGWRAPGSRPRSSSAGRPRAASRTLAAARRRPSGEHRAPLVGPPSARPAPGWTPATARRPRPTAPARTARDLPRARGARPGRARRRPRGRARRHPRGGGRARRPAGRPRAACRAPAPRRVPRPGGARRRPARTRGLLHAGQRRRTPSPESPRGCAGRGSRSTRCPPGATSSCGPTGRRPSCSASSGRGSIAPPSPEPRAAQLVGAPHDEREGRQRAAARRPSSAAVPSSAWKGGT